MILNLRGVGRDGLIVMDMPNVLLDRRYKYKVGVHRIHFVPQERHLTLENNELLLLSTNLVDRSSTNPCQSIVYFNYVKTNKIQSQKIQDIIFHGLHLYELSNASFTLQTFTGRDAAIKIRDIFLQLEIIREDTYGRI